MRKEFDVQKFDVSKFDSILGRGLSCGLGKQGSQLCIEAAICETLGLPHGDDPGCVAQSVRYFKIALNDASWSSPKARAKGLRKLGLAQLGSLGVVDNVEFSVKLSRKIISTVLPALFREVFNPSSALSEILAQCEKDGDVQSAKSAAQYAAQSAKYAAKYAAQSAKSAAQSAAQYALAPFDKYLELAAQLALDVLKELDSPGCRLLR